MSENETRNFLKALRRMTRQVSLYPEGHPLTDEAGTILESTTLALLGHEPEAVLAINEDSFYLDRSLLPHTSLEHNGILRELQARAINSISLKNPVSPGDLFDMSAFIAGVSDDIPAGGTIRFNENPLFRTSLDNSAMNSLRRSYAGGLDALRAATTRMSNDASFDMINVVKSVQGLLSTSLDHSSATLLLTTVKSHDEYTFYHSLNLCILSLALGKFIGLGDDQLVLIGAGAALHDIGKTRVPASILNHPGRLSADQWKEMKTHPQEGATAIMAAGGDAHEVTATIALEHHARYDGSGYPGNGDFPSAPHAYSALVSVIDVYDSITTRRPYRRAGTPSEALDVVLRGSGTDFHPDMVRAFIEMMGIYPPGSLLRLDTGEIAMVTSRPAGNFSELDAVVAVTASGEKIEPEPLRLEVDRVVGQLLPDEAGVDPATLLGQDGVQHQVFD
ncbi:MAG: HD domain-containing protein [Acidimicrobiia bacterium]|nr:HD domain-containing protein [Acidimicrobiia bacterium]